MSESDIHSLRSVRTDALASQQGGADKTGGFYDEL